MHTTFAKRLGISPDPNTSSPVTQLDGITMSDGRHNIQLTIGCWTANVSVLIHRNSPHPFLIGRFTGHLFKLDINMALNQVYQLTPEKKWIALTCSIALPAAAANEAVAPSAAAPHQAGAPSLQDNASKPPLVAQQPIGMPHVVQPPLAAHTQLTAPLTAHRQLAAESQLAVQRQLAAYPQLVAQSQLAIHTQLAADPQLVARQPLAVQSPLTALRHLTPVSQFLALTPYAAKSCISAEHKRELISTLEEFRSLFAQSDTDIGRIRGAEHHIRLKPGARPIARRPYRHSAADLAEIRRQVQELLAKGLIRESDSPYACPCTLAGKHDGTKRLCVDYRPVNEDTIDEREPLPIVQDVIDQLAKAKIFTTLDMAWGYWQIPMHPDSIDKTAFITPDGHYEWLVLPFGLKNAPPTFQRVIRRVLGNLVNHGVIPYLDDIIIYAENEEVHAQLLREVFIRLRENNIKLRLEKCRFAHEEVEYLGFVVSHGQQRPSPTKTAALENFPIPTTVKQLQRFLGLANWFRRFVRDFSKIAEPLTRLTRKDVEWTWTLQQQTALETIKRALTSSPVVAIYQPDKPVYLFTDASGIGLGSILMQPDDDGHNHVVAYYSRRFNKHEEKYPTWEQEVLAVVESMEHFHVYVHGIHTQIYSDHKALKWLHDIKSPSSRLFRWSVRLSVYTYTIHHRAGAKNEAADAISRAPATLLISVDDLKAAQAAADLSSIRKLDSEEGLLYNSYRGLKRLYVPPPIHQQLLRDFHDTHGHPGITKTLKLILSRYWWPTASEDITRYVKSCRTCQLVKTSNQPRLGKLNPPPTPEHPMNTWAIDTIVMGTAAKATRAKYIQVIVDHHSRYVWAYATPKNTTATIINILTQLFTALGSSPKTIITDNFLSYTAKQFKRFLESHGIKHNLCSPYHPQSNGVVEKANDTIVRGLRLAKLDNPKLKWSTLLAEVTANYNKTPHTATGFSPAYLHFHDSSAYDSSEARGPTRDSARGSARGTTRGSTRGSAHGSEELIAPPEHTDIAAARQLAAARSDSAKQTRKRKHDESHRHSDFYEGDLVLRRLPDNHPSRNKLSPANTGPYVIRRKTGPETYEISPEDLTPTNLTPPNSHGFTHGSKPSTPGE